MEHPLYATEQEALSAPGDIYKHYKGGVYRLIARDVRHSETGEMGVVYEHLWPHDHSYHFRPQGIFFGALENGEQRFKLAKRD